MALFLLTFSLPLQEREIFISSQSNFLELVENIQLRMTMFFLSIYCSHSSLEIMEDMSKRIEAGYEVLYRSIQRE